MKKIFYRELLWFIMAIIFSLLLAFLYLEIMDLSSSDRHLKSIERIFSVQLYLIGCIVSFISIYIVRLIVGIIKVLVNY